MTVQSAPPRQRRGAAHWLATAITEITGPAPTVAAQLLVVAWHSTPSPTQALLWWALAALFGSVLPIAFIAWGARVGWWIGHHVPARHQRLVPMGTGVLFMVTGVAILTAVGAPHRLTSALVAVTVMVALLTLITNWWKISAHTALAAGLAVVLVLTFGPWLALTWPLVALTAWSRLHLTIHTVAQVLAGGLVGATTTATLFLVMR